MCVIGTITRFSCFNNGSVTFSLDFMLVFCVQIVNVINSFSLLCFLFFWSRIVIMVNMTFKNISVMQNITYRTTTIVMVA